MNDKESLENDIKEAITRLVMNLYHYDDEIIHLMNLGFISATHYGNLRCRLDGIEIVGKDREPFGLWDRFDEEVDYEESIEAAKATGECHEFSKPFLADRDSGKVISFFEGVDKHRMNNLIEFVNETVNFGSHTPQLNIPALLTESRAKALTRELPNKYQGHTKLHKL